MKTTPFADAENAIGLVPTVIAPSLEGLSARVPSPANITEDQLLRAFHALHRERSTRRVRAVEETVALGDEIEIDTLGFVNGKLIPFSARFKLRMELAEQIQLPGLAKAIAGEQVGDSLEITLTLPATYPVATLRGKSARFLIVIRSAWALTLPDVEKPGVLATLGRGDSLEKVMSSLREDLELELANELIVQGQELIFDVLLARAPVTIPTSLTDAEIKRRWAATEGRELVQNGFDVSIQEQSLNGWLTDATTRADCERRLAISVVLGAIAARDKLVPTQDDVIRLVSTAAAGFGFTPEQAKSALSENKELTTRMVRTAFHLFAVEHVMKHASLSFDALTPSPGVTS